MAYPGDGYSMAMYGKSEPTPEESAGYWKQNTKRHEVIHKHHLAVTGNGTDVWPGEATIPEEELPNLKTYFQNVKIHEKGSSYDRMFHQDQDYNSKLHRDDRQHTVGLDIPSEEAGRRVPVRSSSEYGRRVDEASDPTVRKHVRIARVMKGFYRTRGTGIPSSSTQ